jgi:hypothetical protein
MKRKLEGESSLELLLDTICNTFGGVIFMAILVVILVQMTSKSVAVDSPPPDQQALTALEGRRGKMQAQLNTLRRAVQQHSRLMDDLTDAESRKLLEDLKRKQAGRDQMLDDRSQAWGEVSQAQIKTNEISEQLKRLSDASEAARQALASAEQTLQQEVAKRSQTARYSMLRPATKGDYALAVRFGRLYQLQKIGPDGNFSINTVDCELKKIGGRDSIVLKASGGRPLASNATPAIGGVLAEADKNLHHLAVFVWPDSFQYFAALRAAFVAAGFEYRLDPMRDEDPLTVGAQTAPVEVQ